jgi:hypothetical protein
MAVAWHWAKEMPRSLRGGFLTLLYALAALADSTGRLRFARDGKPIRISDIAEASGCDEKDCRRYLLAAEAAGVVLVEGERRRGRTTLYIILVTPVPDWGASVASLDSTRRKPRTPPPWVAEKRTENGGLTPELSGDEFRGLTPELWDQSEKEVPGTHPRPSSGDSPRNGSGDSPRNNPGSTQELPHETAEVVTQPQEVAAPAVDKTDPDGEDKPDAIPDGFVRCTKCHERMVPRRGQAAHVHAHCDPQSPKNRKAKTWTSTTTTTNSSANSETDSRTSSTDTTRTRPPQEFPPDSGASTPSPTDSAPAA